MKQSLRIENISRRQNLRKIIVNKENSQQEIKKDRISPLSTNIKLISRNQLDQMI